MQAYLIDASIYIFRSYFTLPDNWRADESDYPTQAVFGFTSFLIDLLKQKKPDYLFCAFDESLGSGFRHQLDSNYKANRELPDEALAFQLNACRQVCRVMGIREMASDSYEADDLIGSVANGVREMGGQPIIVTRDKDLTQIIREGDLFWDYGKYAPKTQYQLNGELQLRCEQMADYLALIGDSSDNIAGVPGVGPKTARQLLAHYCDIGEIFENLDRLCELPVRGAGKLAEKLCACREQVFLSKQLATIVTDVERVPGLDDIAWQGLHGGAFEIFCEEMGLGTALLNKARQLKLRQC